MTMFVKLLVSPNSRASFIMFWGTCLHTLCRFLSLIICKSFVKYFPISHVCFICHVHAICKKPVHLSCAYHSSRTCQFPLLWASICHALVLCHSFDMSRQLSFSGDICHFSSTAIPFLSWWAHHLPNLLIFLFDICHLSRSRTVQGID